MSEDVELWHYAYCQKSRRARDALEEAGVGFEVRKYTKDEPSADEVRRLADKVGDPELLVREAEDPADELDEDERSDRDALAALISEHPKALQRPVIVHGDDAWVARDEDQLADALDALS